MKKKWESFKKKKKKHKKKNQKKVKKTVQNQKISLKWKCYDIINFKRKKLKELNASKEKNGAFTNENKKEGKNWRAHYQMRQI